MRGYARRPMRRSRTPGFRKSGNPGSPGSPRVPNPRSPGSPGRRRPRKSGSPEIPNPPRSGAAGTTENPRSPGARAVRLSAASKRKSGDPRESGSPGRSRTPEPGTVREPGTSRDRARARRRARASSTLGELELAPESGPKKRATPFPVSPLSYPMSARPTWSYFAATFASDPTSFWTGLVFVLPDRVAGLRVCFTVATGLLSGLRLAAAP